MYSHSALQTKLENVKCFTLACLRDISIAVPEESFLEAFATPCCSLALRSCICIYTIWNTDEDKYVVFQDLCKSIFSNTTNSKLRSHRCYMKHKLIKIRDCVCLLASASLLSPENKCCDPLHRINQKNQLSTEYTIHLEIQQKTWHQEHPISI